MGFVANFVLFLSAKEVWTLVKVRDSYRWVPFNWITVYNLS